MSAVDAKGGFVVVVVGGGDENGSLRTRDTAGQVQLALARHGLQGEIVEGRWLEVFKGCL